MCIFSNQTEKSGKQCKCNVNANLKKFTQKSLKGDQGNHKRYINSCPQNPGNMAVFGARTEAEAGDPRNYSRPILLWWILMVSMVNV